MFICEDDFGISNSSSTQVDEKLLSEPSLAERGSGARVRTVKPGNCKRETCPDTKELSGKQGI